MAVVCSCLGETVEAVPCLKTHRGTASPAVLGSVRGGMLIQARTMLEIIAADPDNHLRKENSIGTQHRESLNHVQPLRTTEARELMLTL